MKVTRLQEVFRADNKRVILRSFIMNEKRSKNIIERVNRLSEDQVDTLINEIFSDFNDRHRNLKERLYTHYKIVKQKINIEEPLSDNRKLLIGAYFSMEYAIESAALFNPSIVPHPDQSTSDDGDLTLIMSMRATGEGHISSIEFREGILKSDNSIEMIYPTRIVTPPKHNSMIFSKKQLTERFNNLELLLSTKFLSLPENFTAEKWKDFIDAHTTTCSEKEKQMISQISAFIDSNYQVSYPEAIPVSERVLFPYSKDESMGMEDIRLVAFKEDDGSVQYYGTFTAYNGKAIQSKLLRTDDFLTFSVETMNGDAIKDKGMALFPRKINGKYYMISRQDGESLYIMSSENLYQWDNADVLMIPEESWEFIQTGNCGSPIEVDEGWLLITHSVGAMRKYTISALLLDKENPVKVIGKLKKPLLSPTESEREGYVPNVVYSCGSIVHKKKLLIPYAMSDSASGFAMLNVEELIEELLQK